MYIPTENLNLVGVYPSTLKKVLTIQIEMIYLYSMNIESIFIEIDKCYTGFDKNVIVCCIYRPPNTDINMFIEHVSQIMSNIKPENKYVYVMGDFNLNLLNVDKT